MKLLDDIANAFSSWTQEKPKKKKKGNFINDDVPAQDSAKQVEDSINKALNLEPKKK